MNIEKLKKAEKAFLERYPGGFQHPEMIAIGRKHKMEKMTEETRALFAPDKFLYPKQIVADMAKIVGKATMVSLFEKPKFRDFSKNLGSTEQEGLCYGLKELLHGDMKEGFETVVDILAIEKLAKWTLMTIIPIYYRPSEEIFVKPTTTKNVISFFELEGLTYKATPTWDFYEKYRSAILNMKSKVSSDLGNNNAAFTGFLMMSMPE